MINPKSSLKQLIKHFEGCDEFPIEIEHIKQWIIKGGYQEEIEIYATEKVKFIRQGIITCRI